MSANPPATPLSPGENSLGERLFAGLAGGILAIAVLKYGNPVIFDGSTWVDSALPASAQGSFFEWLFGPWPTSWMNWAVLALGLSLLLTRWTWKACSSTWLIALPLLWLAWQGAASLRTISPDLTKPVLRHFALCVVWFYLGVFGMAALRRRNLFFGLLTVGFGIVVAVGWEQHWFGLEQTRRYFYELPNWRDFPPAFLKKLSSDRIYSTLFYPNALAGAILLLLPVTLAWIWHVTVLWERKARVFLTGLVGAASLACLYWSESKAGWLILVVMGGVVLMRAPIPRRLKIAFVVVALVGGLGVFFVRYAGYFSRGATSMVARFDYWKAAFGAMRSSPVLGTGPGTFMIHYSKVKPPEAEMARLVHNDYLQQGCDSGLPGALAYCVFIWGSLWWLYRKSLDRPLHFAVWLGLLGLSIQSLVEFGLYIPALSWPFFFFLGWLLSDARSDTLRPA